MRQLLRIPYSYLVLMAMLVTACSTIEVNGVWRDPSYQARPYRIMVIGMAKSTVSKRIFEDEFTRQLNNHRTEAIASYTVLPDSQQGDHAAIAAKLTELGADAVLITRVVSRKTEQFYVPGTPYYPPPYYGTWPDYYGYGYQAMYTPGYMAEEEFALIETNLYEARNDKLVWAASSEVGIRGAVKDRIMSYINVMVKAMVGDGLVRP